MVPTATLPETPPACCAKSTAEYPAASTAAIALSSWVFDRTNTPITCGVYPSCPRDSSHSAITAVSSSGERRVRITGSAPLNTETVPVRRSVLPSTSEVSGGSSRSAWRRIWWEVR